jgi:hypothetical protein
MTKPPRSVHGRNHRRSLPARAARSGALLTARAPPRQPGKNGDSVQGFEAYARYRIVAHLGRGWWGYRLSRDHPQCRIEVLERQEAGPGLVRVVFRMSGPGAADWAAENPGSLGLVHFESQVENAHSVLYRVTTKVPRVQKISRRHRVLAHFPVVLQDGVAQFETFGSGPQLRAYLHDLRAEVGPSQVTAVQQASLPSGAWGLTPAQERIFRSAIEFGYFQSPRGISVTRLAARLGRSKSTVSTALVKIQSRLARSALAVDLGSLHTMP